MSKEFDEKEFVAKRIQEFLPEAGKGKRVTALVVEPNKEPYVKEICEDYESMYCLLGGPLEGISPYGDEISIVCNEWGKVLGLPPNRALFGDGDFPYDVIAGTFVVVGATYEDEYYSSLPEDMIEKYYNMFKDPVCKWRYSLTNTLRIWGYERH